MPAELLTSATGAKLHLKGCMFGGIWEHLLRNVQEVLQELHIRMSRAPGKE